MIELFCTISSASTHYYHTAGACARASWPSELYIYIYIRLQHPFFCFAIVSTPKSYWLPKLLTTCKNIGQMLNGHCLPETEILQLQVWGF